MSATSRRNPAINRIATSPRPEPTHDDIGLCAQCIWEEEGRPQGRDLEHWLLAEAWLRQSSQGDADAGDPPRRNGRNGSKRTQPEGIAL